MTPHLLPDESTQPYKPTKRERGVAREPSSVRDRMPGVADPGPRSQFAGVGVLTAWEPRSALRLAGLADWVALQGDPEGGATPDLPAALVAAGFRVYEWQARAATRRWPGVPYIGQAESQAELEACLALNPPGPKALVGNPTAWTTESMAKARAQRWELLIECYENADPGVWDRLDSRGYPVASVVYGCYDATGEQPGGRRVPLAEYLAHPPRWPNWSAYHSETLTEDDVAAMKAWRT